MRDNRNKARYWIKPMKEEDKDMSGRRVFLQGSR
jgi:hypothetical protein